MRLCPETIYRELLLRDNTTLHKRYAAMVTLRERTTQYGVIVNLPDDHTAASVNAAVTGAFTAMPAHMKRTLTWDQGVEMA